MSITIPLTVLEQILEELKTIKEKVSILETYAAEAKELATSREGKLSAIDLKVDKIVTLFALQNEVFLFEKISSLAEFELWEEKFSDPTMCLVFLTAFIKKMPRRFT